MLLTEIENRCIHETTSLQIRKKNHNPQKLTLINLNDSTVDHFVKNKIQKLKNFLKTLLFSHNFYVQCSSSGGDQYNLVV